MAEASSSNERNRGSAGPEPLGHISALIDPPGTVKRLRSRFFFLRGLHLSNAGPICRALARVNDGDGDGQASGRLPNLPRDGADQVRPRLRPAALANYYRAPSDGQVWYE